MNRLNRFLKRVDSEDKNTLFNLCHEFLITCCRPSWAMHEPSLSRFQSGCFQLEFCRLKFSSVQSFPWQFLFNGNSQEPKSFRPLYLSFIMDRISSLVLFTDCCLCAFLLISCCVLMMMVLSAVFTILSVSEIGVMGVQCKKEGTNYTTLGFSSVQHWSGEVHMGLFVKKSSIQCGTLPDCEVFQSTSWGRLY